MSLIGGENQPVLPFGTPTEVQEKMRQSCEPAARGAGFIACSCHNVQAGTLVENVLAMICAVQSEGR